MAIWLVIIMASIGIATCLTAIGAGISMLINRTLTVRRNRHWKRNAEQASEWLGSWGA